MNNKLENKNVDFLFKAILSLETREECYDFFEDVATINEVKSLAQRMYVAKLLNEKRTYSEIAEITVSAKWQIPPHQKSVSVSVAPYLIHCFYPSKKSDHKFYNV